MALSYPELLVALRAPSQLGPEGEVDTGPHIARVSAPPGKVMWTPQPADPVGRAEPSVRRKAVGRGLRHVFLNLLPGEESLHVGRGSYLLRLSLSPGGVYTGNMAESDCIEGRGRGGRGSAYYA